MKELEKEIKNWLDTLTVEEEEGLPNRPKQYCDLLKWFEECKISLKKKHWKPLADYYCQHLQCGYIPGVMHNCEYVYCNELSSIKRKVDSWDNYGDRFKELTEKEKELNRFKKLIGKIYWKKTIR